MGGAAGVLRLTPLVCEAGSTADGGGGGGGAGGIVMAGGGAAPLPLRCGGSGVTTDSGTADGGTEGGSWAMLWRGALETWRS